MAFEGWEEAQTTEDFFSALDDNTEIGTSAEEIIDKVIEEEGNTPDKNKPTIEASLFDDEDIENAGGESFKEDEEDDNKNNPATANISLLNSLKERGLLEYDLEEGVELTEELADELIEDRFEETIDERIKDKLSALPEDAQEAIQFVLQGGSFSEYIRAITSDSGVILSEDMDLESEENQVLVLQEILGQEEDDEEFIESQIEALKDNGKLKVFAEKKFAKWLTETKAKKTALLEAQAAKKIEAKNTIKESKRKVIEVLSKSEDIGGLQPSKEDKREVASYMNDRAVALQNGAEITEMQKELFYELPKNETAMIQLAILLRNRNEDGTFNFESIINKTKTKLTKDIKDNVRRGNSGLPGSAQKKSRTDKSLAAYFSTN